MCQVRPTTKRSPHLPLSASGPSAMQYSPFMAVGLLPSLLVPARADLRSSSAQSTSGTTHGTSDNGLATSQQPVLVISANPTNFAVLANAAARATLAGFAATRVRCIPKQTSTAQVYAAPCRAVSHQPNGSELHAISLQAGALLTRQRPQATRSSASFAQYAPQADERQPTSNVTVNASARLTEAKVLRGIPAAETQSRTASPSRLLPCAVGFAAGSVPGLPRPTIVRLTASCS